MTKLNLHFPSSIIYILLFTIGYFYSKPAITQNTVIDSLEYELQNNTLPEHLNLDLYYQLAKNYQQVDINQSSDFAKKLLKISKEIDSLYWATYALDMLIINYESINKFDSCVKYSKEAIEIAKAIDKLWDVAYFQSLLGGAQVKLGNYYDALENYEHAVEFSKKDSSLIKYETAFLTNIGGIYHYLGDDLKALDYFLQSYYIKKEHNLTDNLSPSLINIASVYSKLEKFEDAIKTHNEALRLATEIDDYYYQMKALTGLGFDYYLMKEYDQSVNYYLKALQYSDSSNDKTSKANILAKLSNVYHQTGDTEKAFNYAERSLTLSREINYQFGISSFSRTLGDLYTSENKFSQALPLLQESIEISRNIGAAENLKDSYYSISIVYEELNNKNKALEFYKMYSRINDSLLLHEEADKFTVVQIKYEMEKKSHEVENLTYENEINELKLTKSKYLLYGFIAFFSMVFLFLVLLIRQNKLRNQQKNIILEQKLLRSQMNPHFIFNTLAAIQKYIYDKSSLLATDYLGRFTKLMRFILQSSSIEQISLEDERTFLDNYIKLQALRFNNNFDYELKIDPEIEPESMNISPMLIQPFAENAIEHGLNPLGEGGFLKINFSLKDDYINVVVEDNGIGRTQAKIINEQKKPGHKSMAMNITKERLAYLNKKSNRTIHVSVNDLTDETGNPLGTRIMLNIPFIYS